MEISLLNVNEQLILHALAFVCAMKVTPYMCFYVPPVYQSVCVSSVVVWPNRVRSLLSGQGCPVYSRWLMFQVLYLAAYMYCNIWMFHAECKGKVIMNMQPLTVFDRHSILCLLQAVLYVSVHIPCWLTAPSGHMKQRGWWNGCRIKNGASWF